MTLSLWLQQIEKQKPSDVVNLGLERVRDIAQTLNLLKPASKVITVAGTNGKGTSIAALEQLLLCHGKSVGTYTSPHLLNFNERISTNGTHVSDQVIIEAFEFLSTVKEASQLTYFEWITITALLIFKSQSLDYILLEVGLGGRLDAVNVIDADIALITSIDFDHMDYLGNTLDEIALEKAGIFRPGQQVFCGEPNPPASLSAEAVRKKTFLCQNGKQYRYSLHDKDWSFTLGNDELHHLPILNLHLNNISNALACFLSLGITFSNESIKQSLLNISLLGRTQLVSKDYPILYDVAHNKQSISQLCHVLSKQKHKCIIVFSMLQDKEIKANIKLLSPFVSKWYIAPVKSGRSYGVKDLASIFEEYNNISLYSSIEGAYKAAIKDQRKDQLLVSCGSFLTVAETMAIS